MEGGTEDQRAYLDIGNQPASWLSPTPSSLRLISQPLFRIARFIDPPLIDLKQWNW